MAAYCFLSCSRLLAAGCAVELISRAIARTASARPSFVRIFAYLVLVPCEIYEVAQGDFGPECVVYANTMLLLVWLHTNGSDATLSVRMTNYRIVTPTCRASHDGY
eukprot:895662-Pleurochrysis_carterae.AAC.1